VLTFNDYLFGLAAMEPCTQHGGMPAEQRCRYIFRYYDHNGDGLLQMDEFRLVVKGSLYSAMKIDEEFLWY
jgi:Ca2+-binding EF-hand superfamily protein